MVRVFISYAREDAAIAQRVFRDLRQEGVDAWLDSEMLLPGEPWRTKIGLAIRESSYFIALISTSAVNKVGFVQRELKQALDLLDEHPTGDIFIIPARCDECRPSDPKLAELNWVDLFPDYSSGLKTILRVVCDGRQPSNETQEELKACNPARLREKFAHVVNWYGPLGLKYIGGAFRIYFDRFTFDSFGRSFVIPFDAVQEIIAGAMSVKIKTDQEVYVFNEDSFPMPKAEAVKVLMRYVSKFNTRPPGARVLPSGFPASQSSPEYREALWRFFRDSAARALEVDKGRINESTRLEGAEGLLFIIATGEFFRVDIPFGSQDFSSLGQVVEYVEKELLEEGWDPAEVTTWIDNYFSSENS